MMLPYKPPVDDPDVVRLAREFKAALNARADLQVYKMTEQWVKIEDIISGRISNLLLEIETMIEGSNKSAAAIRELARYRELQAQVRQEITTFARVVEGDIRVNQLGYGITGAHDAAELISASYTNIIGANFNQLPVSAIETMVGYLGDGTPLNRLLVEAYPVAWAGMSDALTEGVALGLGARKIAENMTQALGTGFARISVIARTETLRAYRQSSVMQYQESGVVKGFQRLVNKSGACMACIMSDGEYFPVEAYFTDHPNGRCTCIPVIEGMKPHRWDKAQNWFERQEPDKQREIMGSDYFDAWKARQYQLEDLRSTAHSSVWGDSPKVTPLRSLGVKINKPPKVTKQPVITKQPVKASVRMSSRDAVNLPNDFLRKFQTSKENATYDKIEPAFDDIDKVINVGTSLHPTIQTIDVQVHPLQGGHGSYIHYADGTPYRIRIDPNSSHVRLTTIHEYGHYMDSQMMGKTWAQFATETGVMPDGELRGWWEAVNNTKWLEEIDKLRTQCHNSQYAGMAGSYEQNLLNYLDYLKSPEECFARSFAQYIAIKTQEPELLEQVKDVLTDGVRSGLWEANDFVGIEKALDEYFEGLGWLK